MDKRKFLKTGGLLGLASVFPLTRAFAASDSAVGGACVLIPTETSGPFPLDLTTNTFYFRQDVREGQPGAPLRLRLRIIGNENCGPMSDLRVNIWHCSSTGLYSGYSQNGNQGQVGLTYLRGYQFTDTDGVAEFLSIFPGWYPGRVCHIHFQVFVNSNYAAISQLTFPIDAKQAIYTDNPQLYPDGIDPMTPAEDGVFSDGYQYQVGTLTYNDQTHEYESLLEVTINGSGVTTGLQELLNRQQFSVGQNFPNPHLGLTRIPFSLVSGGDVMMDLYDLDGRHVAHVDRQGLSAGQHEVLLDFQAMGLPLANYALQFDLHNAQGDFRTSMLITAVR